MKVEVELQPGVTLDNPAVQELVKQLEEIPPQGFRQELMRRLDGAMRAVDTERIPGREARIKRIHQRQVEAVIDAVRSLIETTALPTYLSVKRDDEGVLTGGVFDFRESLMRRLK